MSKVNCARCGGPVECGMAQGQKECWCAELPAVMPVPGGPESCLCRKCLEAEIALKWDREKSRAGLCADCVSAKRLKAKGGSILYICERSASDSALGPTTTDAVVSWVVYVVLASITIGGPVVYYLVGGDQARATLDGIKGWLVLHSAAVMTVLFLVLGVKLIGDGLPGLGG